MQGQPLEIQSEESSAIAAGDNLLTDCRVLCNSKGFQCPAFYIGEDDKCHLVTLPLYANNISGTGAYDDTIDAGFKCYINY